MEAVPRLPMITCDLKISPSNTEFGSILKKYIRDHYHEDPDSYSKEIKELETLRQNAIKAPMDFTGCSILKRYYSQLHKLQSRFPMTDDGAACVPFMWTDIYSGVAYNITDIEYEEACILYNIGALHSKLGTMDSRCNAEGMKIACTHFQCAAWAFQHLRDTYPQPKGSDMSHDLLTFFINIMLAQAQECILEKSMLDGRKSQITAKIAAQVVDYYKCALGIMVSGSPSTDTGSVLDIVGSKIFKSWKKFIEFKMSYYTSISHLYMGNQAEEHEKWGERVSWFQAAYDHLTEAFKIAKNIDRDDLNEPLTFTMDVIGGKHNSAKKENEFVYHEKVPVLSSLPELKGASLVKGIPFSTTDPDVSGPDIFARLVPMEAHETSSLYSEEKAKILRSVVAKIEGKNEELMAYLSSLQLESGTSFNEEEKIPQDLLEKCAAMSVRPTAISELTELMNELLNVSRDVDTALKTSAAILLEEEQKEIKHQSTFGKRGPAMITVELKKECSKYEEAHRKAVESNNTLEAAVNIHISNLTKLLMPLEELAQTLPSMNIVKTPENVKIMEDFNHLVNKVEEMRKQREYLEQQLRDSLIKDDITKNLVTMDKKGDLQSTFAEELKKHSETLTYIDQNLAAQDNILCALTEANARYADTRKAITEIKHQRDGTVKTLISSYEAYDDLVSKARKGLEFYQKLQNNVNRLLTRIRSVTKVQDEERSQFADAELRKGSRISPNPTLPHEQHVPKLKDYLPYMSKRSGIGPVTVGSFSNYALPQQQTPGVQFVPEPMRQSTMGGPSGAEFDRKLKPVMPDNIRSEDKFDVSSMGVRPAPLGSEQTTIPPMCTSAVSSSDASHLPSQFTRQWSEPNSAVAPFASSYGSSYTPYQYPTQSYISPANNTSINSPLGQSTSNVTFSQLKDPNMPVSQYTLPTCNAIARGYGEKTNYSSPQPSPHITNSGVMPSVQTDSSVRGASTVTASGAMSQVNGFPVSPGQMPNFAGAGGPSAHPLHVPAALSQIGGPTSFPGSVSQSSTASAPFMQPVSMSSVGSAAEMSHFRSMPNTAVPPHLVSSVNSFNVTPSSSLQTIPMDSSSTVSQPSIQNQMHPVVSHPNQYSPLRYNVAPQAFDHRIAENINSYHPGVHPMQYYQPNVYTNPASVTASMDTRTNTFNSLDPSTVQSSNFIPHPHQNGIGYPINSNDARNFNNVNSNCSSVTSQTLNYTSHIPSNKFSSTTAHPSMNAATYGNMTSTSFQNYDGNNPVVHSQGMQLPQNPVYAATILNAPVSSQNLSAPQPTVQFTLPSGGTVLNAPVNISPQNHPTQQPSSQFTLPNSTVGSDSKMFVNQQSYDPQVSSVNYYGHIGTNQMHDGNLTAHSQQSQIPMVPNPAYSQPLQPIPASSTVSNNTLSDTEVNGSTVSVDKHCNTIPKESKLNEIRDLITPPPEQESGKLKESEVKDDSKSESSFQVLQPKVIDLKSITPSKEKEPIHLAKDPLDDPSVRSKFVCEVEKYEKFVDGLVRKSLNGTTPLDQKWKELIDAQDKESRKMSISVARCYPLKNRFPDVMPYDNNRVKLVSAKDDYINASYLKDVCPTSPVFVITQAPLPATFGDFWLMVWEQQVETLICLLSDSELKSHVYVPKERGQVLPVGAFEISLHNHQEKNGFVERMINITHAKNRTSRVVVHLQFTQWPASGVPQSPAPLLQFISDVISYQKQQRNLLRPVVVHCSAGIGRSGCFCLITALVTEMNSGHGPRDVAQVASTVSQQRKFLIQEKDQLKFCYDTVLYYAQDLLMRRGILTTRASFDDKLPGAASSSSHVRHPSEDFILGSGGLAKLQSGMAKMGLSSDQQVGDNESKKLVAPPNECSVQFVTGDVPNENSASGELKRTVESERKAETLNSEPVKDKTDSVDKNVASITSLLDPSNFTLESNSSPAKRKITKENFATSRGSLSNSSSDSADPLSLLDPLWSLKK